MTSKGGIMKCKSIMLHWYKILRLHSAKNKTTNSVSTVICFVTVDSWMVKCCMTVSEVTKTTLLLPDPMVADALTVLV